MSVEQLLDETCLPFEGPRADVLPDQDTDVGMVRALVRYTLDLVETERKEKGQKMRDLEHQLTVMQRKLNEKDRLLALLRQEVGADKFKELKGEAFMLAMGDEKGLV